MLTQEEWDALPTIITRWICQLCDPDIVDIVRQYGGRRRIDIELFSDRDRVTRPPKHTIV